MHRNGFRHILERDAAGWSPLHYAALGNNTELVQSLLEKQANVHCRSRSLWLQIDNKKHRKREKTCGGGGIFVYNLSIPGNSL